MKLRAAVADVLDASVSSRVWFAAWAAAFVAGLVYLIVVRDAEPMQDFRAYYNAGARLNAGLPLYPVGVEMGHRDWYGYPPLFAVVFRLVALLPFDVARVLWAAILGAAVGVPVWRSGPGKVRTWVVLVLLLAPIGYGFVVGQAEVLMIGLVAIGSPLSIAVAANVKLVPILFGVMWLWDRDWSQLRRLLIWCVVLALGQLAVEPAGTLAYLDVLRIFSRTDGWWFTFDASPWRVSPLFWLAVCLGLIVLASWPRLRRPAVIALVTFGAPRVLLYQLGMLVNVVGQSGAKPPVHEGQRGTIVHQDSSLEGSVSPAGPRSGPLGGWPEPRAVLRRLRRPGAS